MLNHQTALQESRYPTFQVITPDTGLLENTLAYPWGRTCKLTVKGVLRASKKNIIGNIFKIISQFGGILLFSYN